MLKRNANVLVVSKTTCFQEMVERNDTEGLRLIREGHPSVKDVVPTHAEHEAALAAVEKELTCLGINFKSVLRRSFKGHIPDEYDLIVTVGGDGSFLDVSHFVTEKVPVLGVNSAPNTSHGHFCLANPTNFHDVMESIIVGAIKPLPLQRLELVLDGNVLPTLVLNEVLIWEREPAGTMRCNVQIGKVVERQKGSGLMIGTAAGSTGFLRSAKGIIQPIGDTSYQYLPMHPFLDVGAKLKLPGGLVDASTEMRVVSGTPDGMLYLDGKYIKHAFPRGSELVVRPSNCPVRAYVNANCHDRYMKPASLWKRLMTSALTFWRKD